MIYYSRILAIFFLLMPSFVLAQDSVPDWQNNLDQGTAGAGLIGQDDPDFKVADLVSRIIDIIIALLAIIFTVLILLGGFRWMTAGGSADKIKEAKQLIINSVIGLLIVLSAYAIARYVFIQISKI